MTDSYTPSFSNLPKSSPRRLLRALVGLHVVLLVLAALFAWGTRALGDWRVLVFLSTIFAEAGLIVFGGLNAVHVLRGVFAAAAGVFLLSILCQQVEGTDSDGMWTVLLFTHAGVIAAPQVVLRCQHLRVQYQPAGEIEPRRRQFTILRMFVWMTAAAILLTLGKAMAEPLHALVQSEERFFLPIVLGIGFALPVLLGIWAAFGLMHAAIRVPFAFLCTPLSGILVAAAVPHDANAQAFFAYICYGTMVLVTGTLGMLRLVGYRYAAIGGDEDDENLCAATEESAAI